MKRVWQRRKKLFNIMRINLTGFLILVVVGVVSFQMVRIVLLQNMQELGASLAGSSASETQNKLTVYETLLSFGAEVVAAQLEQGVGRD